MLSRSSLVVPSLVLSLALAGCGGGEADSAAMGGEEGETMASTAEGSAEEASSMAAPTAQDAPTCWLREGVTAEAAAERVSPRDSASISLDAGIAKICYGAPSMRDREIMGGLVPYDEVWRSGADEATALHLTFPAEVAGVAVDPGVYSLMTIPGTDSWTVVVNRNAERWGIPITDEVRSADVGTGTVTPEETESTVEQMRYRFEQEGPNEALLLLEWEDTRVPIPIEAR